MATCGAALGRSFVAGVVISANPLIGCGVMRSIMIFAAFMIGLGTLMAQIADKMTPARANTVSPKAVAVAAVETPAPSGLRSLSIARDARGHFATEGRIDG